MPDVCPEGKPERPLPSGLQGWRKGWNNNNDDLIWPREIGLISLSICLSVFLSISLSFCLSVSLSECLSGLQGWRKGRNNDLNLIWPRKIGLNLFISIFLSLPLSNSLYFSLSICLYVCMSEWPLPSGLQGRRKGRNNNNDLNLIWPWKIGLNHLQLLIRTSIREMYL